MSFRALWAGVPAVHQNPCLCSNSAHSTVSALGPIIKGTIWLALGHPYPLACNASRSVRLILARCSRRSCIPASFRTDKQCPGNTCRRQCRGEDEGSHPVDEILAYRPATGDVCAGRCRCLAEGAHEEIYIPDASGFFGAAQAAQSPYAECMGFVHIEQYVGVSFFSNAPMP